LGEGEGLLPEKVGWECAAHLYFSKTLSPLIFLTKICDVCYFIYYQAQNLIPFYDCCGQNNCPKHMLCRAFVDGLVFLMIKKYLLLRNIPNPRLEAKTIPYL